MCAAVVVFGAGRGGGSAANGREGEGRGANRYGACRRASEQGGESESERRKGGEGGANSVPAMEAHWRDGPRSGHDLLQLGVLDARDWGRKDREVLRRSKRQCQRDNGGGVVIVSIIIIGGDGSSSNNNGKQQQTEPNLQSGTMGQKSAFCTTVWCDKTRAASL